MGQSRKAFKLLHFYYIVFIDILYMSTNILPNDIVNKIRKLYSTSGYMSKYGTDLWVSFILCLIFSLAIAYQHSVNAIQVVRANWTENRCNPLFIPFAGFINPQTDRTNLEYTAENFNGCINSMLKNIAIISVSPFYLAVRILNDACNSLIDSVNKLRDLFYSCRDQYLKYIKQIYAAFINLVVHFINFTVKMKDSMSKIEGLLATTIFTILGSYMTLQSLFMSIANFIAKILYYLDRMAYIWIDLSEKLDDIPIVGYALSIAPMMIALIFISPFIAIYLPMLLFLTALRKCMGLSTPYVPGVPSCFAENTPIEMDGSGTSKPIKDIKIGDVLKYGAKVTAVLKLSSAGQNMYNLNGVMVSGEHRVLITSAHLDSAWIKVKDHPDSIYQKQFNEPFLYCLNTDEKYFTINGAIYSDWDDIDENVVEDLEKNCVAHGYLNESFTYMDIHTHLDSGFHKDSTVVLKNGTTIPISKVKVNDVLASGDKVRGVVQVDARDMDTYKYTFGNGYTLTGAKNIHIADNNLGIINGMAIANGMATPMPKEQTLYHLLTDTSFCVVNNIRVNDYNFAIDAYLR